MRLKPTLLAACLLAPSLHAQLDQILPRVQENVAHFQEALPNFVCRERITSSKLSNGEPNKEAVFESGFVGVQEKDKLGRSQYRETRDLISANGKATHKGQKPDGPFMLHGGFSGVLGTTFGADIEKYRNYALAGNETVDGKSMIVIAISTKDGQQGIGANMGHHGFLQKDSGKAWIDPETMHVARVEYEVVNCPGRYAFWYLSVTYAPVTIGEKSYWMPKSVLSKLRKAANAEYERQFTAEYSDYHKFGATSGIVSTGQ